MLRSLAAAAAITLSAAMAAAAADSPPAPQAEAQPAAASGACAYPLSPAVLSAWQGDGDGRLGCATAMESPSSTSPQGSAARVAVFGDKGEIVLHASGPRAGQAYVVSGCFYRLYVQFGGTSGWLGLPVGDMQNTPDGSKQAFEGGAMRYARALSTCETLPAEAAAPAPSPPTAELAPLDLFEKPGGGDRESLASAASVQLAQAAGYQRLRPQARVMTGEAPGAVRLKLFEDDTGARHQTLASGQSERDALAEGYVFAAGQGYVWTDPHPGAVALETFRDPQTGQTWLTAGPADEAEAKARGLAFVRIEGYAAAPQ